MRSCWRPPIVQIIFAHGDDGGARHAGACSVIAFPIAYYAARYASGWTKALFYLAVMMPLWSSYLVKIYAWKLILAKEGILTWLAKGLHLSWLIDGLLAAADTSAVRRCRSAISAPSWSSSTSGFPT